MDYRYHLYFDGSCDPNPGGRIGCGVYILRDGKYHHSISRLYSPEKFGGSTSNNLSEYTALYLGLRYCIENSIKDVLVYGDSNMVIRQMSGEWKIKGKKKIYYNASIETQKLLEKFNSIDFVWIPRESNSIADALSNGEQIHIAGED